MYSPNAPFKVGRDPRKKPTQGKQKYPWRLLRKAGDCFVWENIAEWASIRSAANYQSRMTGVKFTVNRLLDAKPPSIRVTRL